MSGIIITSYARCVEELIHNALDASAGKILIKVNLPKFTVSVTDNGNGITPEDLKEIGIRYATSKCHDLSDLRQLKTFGFRGEALASIQSLGILEVESKHRMFLNAYCKVLKDGTILDYGPKVGGTFQTGSGTAVTVRDLFYKYPVRRKQDIASWSDPANVIKISSLSIGGITPSAKYFAEINDIRRSVECIAIIFPHVLFQIYDEFRDTSVLQTRKTSTPRLMLRQFYGPDLVDSMIPCEQTTQDWLGIQGDMSIKDVNNHYIARCEIHDVINQCFMGCHWNKQDIDPLSVDYLSENSHVGKSDNNPTYIVQLTCPGYTFDISFEPSKARIEFKMSKLWLPDWAFILREVRQFTLAFLRKNDLIDEHIQDSDVDFEHQSYGDLLLDDNAPRSLPNTASLWSDEVRHAKSSVSVRAWPAIRQLQAVRESASKPQSPTTFISRDSYPSEGQGSAMNRQSSTSRSQLSRTFKRQFLSVQPFGDASDEDECLLPAETSASKVLLAQDAFKKWNQGSASFQKLALPIPSLPLTVDINNSGLNVSSASTQSSNRRTMEQLLSQYTPTDSTIFTSTLQKSHLANAKFIAQVDRKFIAVQMSAEKNKEEMLVLIDQHAADERIRVERLYRELVGFGTGELPGRPNVDTMCLSPAPVIKLSTREFEIVTRFQNRLQQWGVIISATNPSGNPDLVTGVAIPSSPKRRKVATAVLMTRTTSRHFSGDEKEEKRAPKQERRAQGGDLKEVYVTHLPKLVADRCAADKRLTRDLIKGYIHWLDEFGDSIRESEYTTSRQSVKTWPQLLRGCPRVIIDILNSKACRGVIMFNDTLTAQQCQELMTSLSECSFPFQCAHGRPSLVPLLRLPQSQHPHMPMLSKFKYT